MATRGQKEINKNWPQSVDSGTGNDDYHKDRQINLVAEGKLGVKTIVSKKNLVGL